jgi:hypothetical protein
VGTTKPQIAGAANRVKPAPAAERLSLLQTFYFDGLVLNVSGANKFLLRLGGRPCEFPHEIRRIAGSKAAFGRGLRPRLT